MQTGVLTCQTTPGLQLALTLTPTLALTLTWIVCSALTVAITPSDAFQCSVAVMAFVRHYRVLLQLRYLHPLTRLERL